MTDSSDTESKDEQNEWLKPNCTIQPRQNNLLDELEEARYASRSEALRAAIEAHAVSILDADGTTTEELIYQIETLKTTVEDLAEQVDEVHEDLQASGTPAQTPGNESEQNSNPIADAVNPGESQTDAALDNDIYILLTELGPMSVPEITEDVTANAVEIHESLSRLVERNYVSSIDDEPIRYQISEIDG